LPGPGESSRRIGPTGRIGGAGRRRLHLRDPGFNLGEAPHQPGDLLLQLRLIPFLV
jgi:hypothetical protein